MLTFHINWQRRLLSTTLQLPLLSLYLASWNMIIISENITVLVTILELRDITATLWFLAVQNSSIGDLVTHCNALTD